jgi:hypothetical protein
VCVDAPNPHPIGLVRTPCGNGIGCIGHCVSEFAMLGSGVQVLVVHVYSVIRYREG